jgi:hypothetical protein
MVLTGAVDDEIQDMVMERGGGVARRQKREIQNESSRKMSDWRHRKKNKKIIIIFLKSGVWKYALVN